MLMGAFWTDKAVRPAVGEHQSPTLLIGAVQFMEMVQAKTFLELNLVLRHGMTSEIETLFPIIMPCQGYYGVSTL